MRKKICVSIGVLVALAAPCSSMADPLSYMQLFVRHGLANQPQVVGMRGTENGQSTSFSMTATLNNLHTFVQQGDINNLHTEKTNGIKKYQFLPCSSDDTLSGLRLFVQHGPSTRPQVEKIPSIKKYQSIPFNNVKSIDPFTSFSEQSLRKRMANANSQPLPQKQKGPIDPLEEYSLSSLTLGGFMWGKTNNWAVFIAPNGNVYRAHVGSPIGNNKGSIVSIDSSTGNVVVKQYIVNAFGGYKKQLVTIHFSGSFEDKAMPATH